MLCWFRASVPPTQLPFAQRVFVVHQHRLSSFQSSLLVCKFSTLCGPLPVLFAFSVALRVVQDRKPTSFSSSAFQPVDPQFDRCGVAIFNVLSNFKPLRLQGGNPLANSGLGLRARQNASPPTFPHCGRTQSKDVLRMHALAEPRNIKAD